MTNLITSNLPALTTGIWGILVVSVFALARSMVTSRAALAIPVAKRMPEPKGDL